MAARSRMKPQYVQYIQYRSVLNAGHALIKTMGIEIIFACSNIVYDYDSPSLQSADLVHIVQSSFSHRLRRSRLFDKELVVRLLLQKSFFINLKLFYKLEITYNLKSICIIKSCSAKKLRLNLVQQKSKYLSTVGS